MKRARGNAKTRKEASALKAVAEEKNPEKEMGRRAKESSRGEKMKRSDGPGRGRCRRKAERSISGKGKGGVRGNSR